jgi:putative transcriptional regulator
MVSGSSMATRIFPSQINHVNNMKNKIKELRARYDLTQEDLAKLVGVRRETIVFLEQGKYNPSLKLAHDIAKALKTTVDELFIF